MILDRKYTKCRKGSTYIYDDHSVYLNVFTYDHHLVGMIIRVRSDNELKFHATTQYNHIKQSKQFADLHNAVQWLVEKHSSEVK